ncbi:signal recognition particle receptor FtsY [Alishewanella longhuensis]|uniref:Signal recognition particle receptor FtsY n=1 Tax=Alishewanella longhuensis TaxID=1091037 RepID=A0ABQ3L1V0_9ALTE|nr:signal recognition particle-docking protein FtsY [Alishewanella longhuensis]GHG76243.1 signal recognition particle receptor FtsY [Alishewanella longhuensis]
MTKQNKLFSWLGFGKKNTEQPAPETDTDVKSAESGSTDQQVIEKVADSNPATLSTDAPLPTVSVVADAEVAKPATPVLSNPVLEETNLDNQASLEQQNTNTSDSTATAAAAIPVSQVTTAVDQQAGIAEIAAEPVTANEPTSAVAPLTAAEPRLVAASPEPVKKPGFFARLKQGLAKTSQNLGSGLASLFVGKKIDDELYEELETQLLLADVGMDTTQKLIKQLTTHADRKALKDADLLFDKLQQDMATLLHDVEQPLLPVAQDGPFVILMVGVNGVGKTTTIGKMAQQFKQQGKSVMLAAGDTFRAAAVEQLQVWGDRNKIPVIAQHTGADSASVIFDAYQAAKARKVDILIADTAGRLQNKAHLMEELKKIVRVLQKIDVKAPHEVMLTLDAGTGQNALSQARLFNEAVPLTGISLTKLDGTAKGGVIFAIADQFKVPIRFIGVGEAIDDLRQFAAKDFIRALFNKD